VVSAIEDMGLAAAAFKVNEYTNRDTTTIIIRGFSRQLKNWWDNHLTYEERVVTLNHTKVDAQCNNIQDAIEALIHTIIVHFIGNPQEG